MSIPARPRLFLAFFALIYMVPLKGMTLVIPAEVETLEEEAYRDRTDIEEVSFAPGSQIKVLPTGVFRGCSALKRIDLPPSLERIGAHAFAYCSSLEEIAFPESLRRIGNNAFSLCSSLREAWIPDSVTELESYTFSDCSSLVKARMPKNPSLLGELIFSGCEALGILEEPSPTPPVFDCASFIFEPEETEAYSRCRLLVPPSSVGEYRKAPGWELFNNIESKIDE